MRIRPADRIFESAEPETGEQVRQVTGAVLDRDDLAHLDVPTAEIAHHDPLLAPRTFLAWREADTPTSGWEREALEGFDDVLGVARAENGEFTPSAVRRVRSIGAGVTTFGVLAIIGAIAVDRAGHFP